MATRKRTTAALAALAAVTIPAAASAGPEPRLAPPGCITVEVQRGGNVWRIGQDAGVTLDVIAALNPHISNLNLVHPGDHIAVSCPGFQSVKADPNLPPPVVVLGNEVQRSSAEPWEGMAPWPGFNKWLPGDGTDGVASQAAVLRALAKAGATGDQLILLAAVTENESNRRIGAIGDTTITDHEWGPSYGVYQIRSRWDQDHTGGPRDRFALENNLDHQAWAAVQVYNGRKGDPMRAWTSYLKGHHKSFVGPYRELAARMGLGA